VCFIGKRGGEEIRNLNLNQKKNQNKKFFNLNVLVLKKLKKIPLKFDRK